ncbi:MAG: TonB family protein [Gammaproteobacteria bacterium]|nr:TonB family protein [Gammaproteobacteria bacterium]
MRTLLARLQSLSPAAMAPSERLGVSIMLALAVHALVVFGVTFIPEQPPRESRNTLDIILVPKETEKPPEQADFLAQASQEGGGESPEKARPTTPTPAPMVAAEPKVTAAAPAPAPPPPPAPEPPPEKRVLTQEKAAVKVEPVETKPPKPPEPEPRPEPEPAPEPEAEPRISAAQLINRSLEMATLSAELDVRMKRYAERPRRKYINARTREYKYAAYMEAWRAKVERVGNLNYPDEARRRRLSGSLLLDVSLKPDGSINKIQLRRSSGEKVLDDAAMRIVRLAAPFARFPDGIREETDILHIERTWQFLGSNQLFAR